MWIRLFRYVLHNRMFVFPLRLCPAEVLRCHTLTQRLLKQWGLPFGFPEGFPALCDHWLGTLIPEPYYQRRFSGDRLIFKAKFTPIRSLCHYWPVSLFQVLSCFSLNVGVWWVIGLHLPLRSCRAVECFTLSNSNSATTVAVRNRLGWIAPTCQCNH